MNYTDALYWFENHELTKSLEVLNELVSEDPANIQLLLLRARIYYKMQKWGDAMNDYSGILEFEPHHREARSGLEMSKSILGYFTPDMFNP